MINLVILGSTGSIGGNTLEIVKKNHSQIALKAITANNNWQKLAQQAIDFRPEFVAIANKLCEENLRSALSGYGIRVGSGQDSIIEAASLNSANTVVTAIVGAAGLLPTWAAIHSKKRICLANKETLVVAGELVMAEIKKNNIELIPVDSEHSAIFQSIQGQTKPFRILLTASGGPFLGYSEDDISKVTLQQALKHPNWNMGGKITIDSSTLMNKGLEIIEAHWLFDVDYKDIEVVVHSQSIIHSMVEFSDGSVIAQLGNPDMKLPIQYALSYPNRWTNPTEPLNLFKVAQLSFVPPDTKVFPCLKYAIDAGVAGGIMPCVLNAANEVAVNFFLSGKISYRQIADVVKKTLELNTNDSVVSIEQLLKIDSMAREQALKIISS